MTHSFLDSETKAEAGAQWDQGLSALPTTETVGDSGAQHSDTACSVNWFGRYLGPYVLKISVCLASSRSLGVSDIAGGIDGNLDGGWLQIYLPKR